MSVPVKRRYYLGSMLGPLILGNSPLAFEPLRLIAIHMGAAKIRGPIMDPKQLGSYYEDIHN